MKHISSRTATAFILGVAALSVSCDKVKPPQPELQSAPTSQAPPAAQDADRALFTETAQKELDKLRKDISEIKDKAEAASAQTRARLSEDVRKLETALGETQQLLARMKAATVESSKQMKDSFNGALETLKGAVRETGGKAT